MFDKIRFKGTWRPYQKRVLENLQRHLNDNRLHLVAAPGAGKTTLGLEVISRIAKPTLIFAPTLTIKAQWRRRLLLDFTDNPGEIDEYISMDINEPRLITITTYQGLLAAFKGQKEEETEPQVLEEEEKELLEDKERAIDRFSFEKADKLLEKLKEKNISLLCFDEAHHLRKEWWKALDYLVKNLKVQHTLSLTGTPPYDVDQNEWQRYEDLCGPIDDIISIAELVKNGTLCPHQDLLYFAKLRDFEEAALKEYTEKVKKFVEMVVSHPTLAQKLYDLPYFKTEKIDVEFLLDKMSFSIAALSLFKSRGYTIPEQLLQALVLNLEDLPPFDTRGIEVLLTELFAGEELFPTCKEEITELRNQAIHLGLTYRRKLCLFTHPRIQKMLSSSVGKLDAISDIVDVEYKNLKDDLRMVILSDYIRKNTLNTQELCLGVIPIFKILKEKKEPFKLAVLTGTLIFIPTEIKEKFLDLLNQKNISKEDITLKLLEQDNRYLTITVKEKVKNQIVQFITDLFTAGYINIIVGTQALLGEGWDAPCINSLVLSSTVSSYMLSNQMRGRALRIVKDKPEKISHIWHVGTIKILKRKEIEKNLRPATFEEQDQSISQKMLSYDLDRIFKRFEGFEAPSLKKPYIISNSLERVFPALKYDKYGLLREHHFQNNTEVCLKHTREETLLSWQESLPGKTSAPALKRGIDTPATRASLNFMGGYWYRFAIAFSLASAFSIPLLSERKGNLGAALIFIAFVWFIFACVMFKPTMLVIKTGSVEKVLRQISLVFLKVLNRQKLIKVIPEQVHIETYSFIGKDNDTFISFSNLSPEENKILINALKEFLDPIENPRYIIERKTIANFFNRKFDQKDYHAVPSVFTRNKKTVELLQEFWEDEVGPCEIIYTRTTQGRKLLLQARQKAFSSINSKNKQISRWI